MRRNVVWSGSWWSARTHVDECVETGKWACDTFPGEVSQKWHCTLMILGDTACKNKMVGRKVLLFLWHLGYSIAQRTWPLAGLDRGMREEPTSSSVTAPTHLWQLGAEISFAVHCVRLVLIAWNTLMHQEVDQCDLLLNSVFPVVNGPAHTGSQANDLLSSESWSSLHTDSACSSVQC